MECVRVCEGEEGECMCLVALILSIDQRCGDATDMLNASQTSHPPAILKSAIVLAKESPSISIVALEDATVVRPGAFVWSKGGMVHDPASKRVHRQTSMYTR